MTTNNIETVRRVVRNDVPRDIRGIVATSLALSGGAGVANHFGYQEATVAAYVSALLFPIAHEVWKNILGSRRKQPQL